MVEWRRQEKRKEKPGDPLHWWLAWLDKKNQPELAEEAIKMNSGIAAAQSRLEELSNDKDFMRLYEMREAARIEWNSSISHARREGIQEGEQRGMRKGRKEGLMEIAAKMKAMGDSIDRIQAITGLSPGEIEKL